MWCQKCNNYKENIGKKCIGKGAARKISWFHQIRWLDKRLTSAHFSSWGLCIMQCILKPFYSYALVKMSPFLRFIVRYVRLFWLNQTYEGRIEGPLNVSSNLHSIDLERVYRSKLIPAYGICLYCYKAGAQVKLFFLITAS